MGPSLDHPKPDGCQSPWFIFRRLMVGTAQVGRCVDMRNSRAVIGGQPSYMFELPRVGARCVERSRPVRQHDISSPEICWSIRKCHTIPSTSAPLPELAGGCQRAAAGKQGMRRLRSPERNSK